MGIVPFVFVFVVLYFVYLTMCCSYNYLESILNILSLRLIYIKYNSLKSIYVMKTKKLIQSGDGIFYVSALYVECGKSANSRPGSRS